MLFSPLAESQLSGTDFVVAEWTAEGTSSGERPFPVAPLHLHREDDEAWYVLEGRLVVRIGDEEVEVSAGSAALVPRGILHTYWNPDPAPARYLLVMTPRIARLIEAIHAASERSPDAMRRLFEAHGAELG